MHRGIHPPEAMMHFPPVSDFPSISEKIFRFRWKFSRCYLFKKILIFICKNFWWLFCQVITTNFELPLYFCCFSTFPPISGKLLFPPCFCKFPSDFVKFMCFLHTLCFSFPPLVWPWCIYASHSARTGCPCTCMNCLCVGNKAWTVQTKLIAAD